MFQLNVKHSAGCCGLGGTPIAPLTCKLLLVLMTHNALRELIVQLSNTQPNQFAIQRPLALLLPADCLPAQQTTQPHHLNNHDDGSHHRAPKAGSRSLVLLHSQAEQPDFVEPIGNHTVAVGREAQLTCKISNLGNYRTAWLRVEDKGILTIHNNIITRNYRFGLANTDDEQSFVLTIKNVQPSDKGGYMCQINSVPMKYAVGYLDVLTPPVFEEAAVPPPEAESADSTSGEHRQPSNSSQVTVAEGAGATLSCLAQGHPRPSITWRREDGRPILLNGLDADLAPLEVRDNSSLHFAKVNRLNSGAYLCIASNGVQPAASKRQLLDVRYSPTITVPETELSGWPGQREAQLECLADLNPAGSYHWVKLATSTTNTDRRPMAANQEDDLWLIEHDELTPSDKFDIVIKQISSEKVRMVLVVRQVEKADFSWYKCLAKNALGLQSNFVRFFESPAGHAPSTTPAPSSFSFKNIIRINDFVSGGGGGGGQQQEDSRLNQPQNDDSRLSFHRSSPSSVPSTRSGAQPAASARTLLNCQFAALLSLVAIATMINLTTTSRAPISRPRSKFDKSLL